MSNATAIGLEKVAFAYAQTALTFDVVIRGGITTAVMGPSGSGKTTLLHLIAGFEEPVSGRILIGDADMAGIEPARRPVSMIFQENNLFSHLDVASNVGLGRSPSLRLTADDRAAVSDALARTELAGKETRLPRELSGGERQRAAIARVLVRNRPVLLLDEPFAALGPALRSDMLDLVKDLQAEHGLTVVLVTHQPEDAFRIADDMVFVADGKVAATGSVADFQIGGGPQAFRDYMGNGNTVANLHHTARKPT